jgi:hypothetical protein
MIREQGNPSETEWEIILNIVLFGNETRMDFYGIPTNLCNRVASTEDFLNPSTWIADISELRGEGLMKDVEYLATHSQLSASNYGRLGYAADTAEEGDQIVVFSDVLSPLIIRGLGPGYFTILGPAYIYGVMNREFIREKVPPFESFL